MQTDNGKRIPIVVPDDQMRHFMAVTATYDEQLLYLDPAEINFQQGDLVRITQGIFTGVVGPVSPDQRGAFAPGRRIGSGRDGCSDCGVTRLIRGKNRVNTEMTRIFLPGCKSCGTQSARL